MLVLTRKESQRILIGDGIAVTVVRIDGNKVRIGIEAPRDLPIQRAEIADPAEEGLYEVSACRV